MEEAASRVRIMEALHLEVPVSRWASSYFGPSDGAKVKLPVPWDTAMEGRRPPLASREVDPDLLIEDWDPHLFRAVMLALMAGTLPAKNFIAGVDASRHEALTSALQACPLPQRTACLQSSDYVRIRNCFCAEELSEGLKLPTEVEEFVLGEGSTTNDERAAIASRMSWPLLYPLVSMRKAASDATVAKVHDMCMVAVSYFNDVRFYKTKSRKGPLKNAAEVLVGGVFTDIEAHLSDLGNDAEIQKFISSLKRLLLGNPVPGPLLAPEGHIVLDVPGYASDAELVMDVECTIWDKDRIDAINKCTSRNMLKVSDKNYLMIFVGWGRCWNKKLKAYVWDERWVSAHRLMYLFTFGQNLSDDDDVAHLCHNRQCLTACHLCEAKTPADNTHLRETTRLPRDTRCFLRKRVHDQQLEREQLMAPIKKRFYGLSLPP